MKQLIFILAIIPMIFSCATLTMDNVKDVPIVTDKVYHVIFEEKAEMVKPEIYSGNVAIGTVLSQQVTSDNIGIMKILIKNEFNYLMKSNVVFYVSESRLEYDTVGENGEPLSEGAKILGFSGKTGLYWFKTKYKVKNLSEAAVNKAQELYNKAGGKE